MWWMYFMIPSAEVLHRHRERSFAWGYGHIPLFAAIAGTGAGLHVAAYYIEHVAHIGSVATVLTVAVPPGRRDRAGRTADERVTSWLSNRLTTRSIRGQLVAPARRGSVQFGRGK